MTFQISNRSCSPCLLFTIKSDKPITVYILRYAGLADESGYIVDRFKAQLDQPIKNKIYVLKRYFPYPS